MSQVLIPLSSFVTRCNTLQHAATRCNTLADTEEYVGQVLIPLSSFVSTNETSKVHIQTSVCSYTRFFRGYTGGAPPLSRILKSQPTYQSDT